MRKDQHLNGGLVNIQHSAPPKQWQTLEELAGLPAIQEERNQEFPVDTDLLPEPDRRRFLQLMAASLALGGATSCRQPVETIVPYVRPPEEIVPGKPLWFATAVLQNGVAQGVLVESHMGRPTKIEGNPEHPASLGATSVPSQAAILTLYDPDRSKIPRGPKTYSSWSDFEISLRPILQEQMNKRGRGVRILTETITSPALGAQIRQFLETYPEARWHQYEPMGAHSERAGAAMAFGRPVNTVYALDKARTVLSLDSDFLACGQGSTRYAHDFAQARRIRGANPEMNRLYAIESTFTSTGGKADHRWPVKFTEVELAAEQIAAALGVSGLQSQPVLSSTVVNALVKDLMSHRGASVVIPGETQSARTHALAHAINGRLGAAGSTLSYTEPVEVDSVDQIASIRDLIGQMNAGAVELLIVLGGNPVWDAPSDLSFGQAFKRVRHRVHFGLYENETSAQSTWHLPQAHSLETWSDAKAFDGTVTILQPLIAPLYGGKSSHELLALLQGLASSSYSLIRDYWRANSGAADFETWWRKSVHDGVLANSAAAPISVRAASLPSRTNSPRADLELTFRLDQYIRDTSSVNNAWLRELPRPITKLTWDNALLMAPDTAKRLDVKSRDVVELDAGGRKLSLPVWVLPGQPEDSLALALGWGPQAGFNAYPLRTSQSLWRTQVTSLRRTGGHYPLASTQLHYGMQDRPLVIWNTIDGYRKEPDFVSKRAGEPERDNTLYPLRPLGEYAWGMTIDLTACVNCNACVIACQAENNIPVVGKEQVLAGRAMHWLRVDTYFEGSPSNPAAHYQPVPCMQCEYAPCELVCPTQATVHSSDGLNDMVYNRCVGTRYCSNNCPYKVRRFNFLEYANFKETIKMMRNPDVTVRSRGVMEKCTYCVQRIREAEILARKEDRKVRDGEVQTACQQVCPTRAIAFGNIADSGSEVSKLKREKLNYSLLAELNTRPRTTYLAELKNPNGEILSAT